MQITTTINQASLIGADHLTMVCTPVESEAEALVLQRTVGLAVNTDRVGACLEGDTLTLQCFVFPDAA